MILVEKSGNITDELSNEVTAMLRRILTQRVAKDTVLIAVQMEKAKRWLDAATFPVKHFKARGNWNVVYFRDGAICGAGRFMLRYSVTDVGEIVIFYA